MEHTVKKWRPFGTLIIAEAGVNHNGDLAMALRLCDAARDAGADVVKFQTWKTEALLLSDAPLAEYQQKNTVGYDSQYAMAKALELAFSSFRKIKEHCDTIGIHFLSTPDEEESLDFLADDLGLKTLKIGSGEVANTLFLTQVARKKRDVILSTGMSTLEEVAAAYDTLVTNGAAGVALLHCTSNYPAPYDEVNLNAMQTLREHFKTSVGYSDHTEGIEVAVAAVALGAEIIEKHITLDRSLPGPDHKASVEPRQFKMMSEAIRNVERALGDGEKLLQPSERMIKGVVQKSLVAKVHIRKGELYSLSNVTAKRAGEGIPASDWVLTEGLAAKRDYSPDELIDI